MAAADAGFDYAAALAQADAEVVAIIAEDFLPCARDDLAQMQAAATSGDLATLGRLAHTYKGLAGNFGARPLQEAAKALQDACARNAFDAALLATMERELQALCAALTAYLAQGRG